MAPVNISVPWVCKLKNDDEGHGLVEEESDFNDEIEKSTCNDKLKERKIYIINSLEKETRI